MSHYDAQLDAAVERERHRVAMRFIGAFFVVVFTVEVTIAAAVGCWPVAPIATLAACFYAALFAGTNRGRQ